MTDRDKRDRVGDIDGERAGQPTLEFKPQRRRGGRRREDHGPQRLSDLMVPTLARMGLKTRARHLQLIGIWPEVVGEHVADTTSVVSFSRGRVMVETESPAMGHQLHLQRQDIIDGINGRLGEAVVSDIRFRLAPGAGTSRAGMPRPG